MGILKLALGKQNAVSGTIQSVSLDTTGLDLLQTLERTLGKRGGVLILSGLNTQPASLIERSGFAQTLGAHGISSSLT